QVDARDEVAGDHAHVVDHTAAVGLHVRPDSIGDLLQARLVVRQDPLPSPAAPLRWRLRGRGRARSTSGAGTGAPTVFTSSPIPSITSRTSSPSVSGGGVSPRLRPHSSPRHPPLPTVPEPSTSPGTPRELRDAYATSSGNGHPAFDSRSSPTRSPLIHASARTARKPSSSRYGSSSSAVTIHGPSVMPKSLPFAGPRRTFISRACRSRADQSFIIV